jgi:hypothetical protein
VVRLREPLCELPGSPPHAGHLISNRKRDLYPPSATDPPVCLLLSYNSFIELFTHKSCLHGLLQRVYFYSGPHCGRRYAASDILAFRCGGLCPYDGVHQRGIFVVKLVNAKGYLPDRAVDNIRFVQLYSILPALISAIASRYRW